MKALTLKNCVLEVIDFDGTLETMQETVGGYIEIPNVSNKLADKNVDIVINEEGKLLDLPFSIVLMDSNTGKMVDVLCGTCLFVSHDDEGNTIGLTEEQIEYVANVFEKKIMFDSKHECRVAVIKEDYM